MKQHLDDLVIFGGKPAYPEYLYVGRPNVGDRDRLLDRINNMLDRRWLTNDGPYVQEFEQRIADYVGVKYCVAVCNATIALEITTRALSMTGEVIVPSFTFVATAHALQWQEITPVFCDVGADSHHLDPASVEAMITPRTSGIVGVHTWGIACDVDALSDIAQRHNLALIFDAAHAFGCTYNGKMIGRFGDAEVFSFHATKFLNSFEGGAIATDDDELARTARFMRNFGFAGYDQVDFVGTNGKMNEAAAAMGLTSLESLDEFVATNERNYRRYRAELEGVPGVTLRLYDADEKSNYHYIVVEIDQQTAGISRDVLVRVLHAENVLARRYFYPGVHRMEPYRSYFPHAGLLLPNTERLTQRVLSLPNGTAVTPDDVRRVCALLQFVAEHGREITRRLQSQGRL